MTLEDLYERFERAVDAYMDDFTRGFPNGHLHTGIRKYISTPDKAIAFFEEANRIGAVHARNEASIKPLMNAAKLYCIARDEGMDAAMLWKLANHP